MIFMQEPDFQENEFMYDDFDLEENLASCECFVMRFQIKLLCTFYRDINCFPSGCC